MSVLNSKALSGYDTVLVRRSNGEWLESSLDELNKFASNRHMLDVRHDRTLYRWTRIDTFRGYLDTRKRLWLYEDVIDDTRHLASMEVAGREESKKGHHVPTLLSFNEATLRTRYDGPKKGKNG